MKKVRHTSRREGDASGETGIAMRLPPRIGVTCDREVREKGRPFSLLREDYAVAISDLGIATVPSTRLESTDS